MEQLQKLYNEKLKYNCTYATRETANGPDLAIIFLGTEDFIIISNYWGVVAMGQRSFNYDLMKATYNTIEKGGHIARSYIEKIIKKYETKRLKINNISIVWGAC